MIILIGSEKGGAGKTTIATNIAAMLASNGRDVLLLDTDTQSTASDWGALRNMNADLPQITVLQKTGDVAPEIPKLVSKYDDIVIDAGGRDSAELRSALLVTHVWYVPLRPSQFDFWTLGKMNSMYTQASMYNKELRGYVLVNSASTHISHDDYGDMRSNIEESSLELSISGACLYERAAYKKAAAEGAGVHELKAKDYDKKAIMEVAELYKEIINGKA